MWSKEDLGNSCEIKGDFVCCLFLVDCMFETQAAIYTRTIVWQAAAGACMARVVILLVFRYLESMFSNNFI